MTAGGAARLTKTLQVRPGSRVLVTGTGPLLVAAAAHFHKNGIEVVACLEAGEAPWCDDSFVSEWGEHALISEAKANYDAVIDAGIPFLRHHAIFEAHGTDAVESVTYGPIDPVTWLPDRAAQKQADVDLVAVRFGFMPNGELASVANCRHEFRHERGGWAPVRDENFRTTRPGIFAVGECGGIGGVAMAVDEGAHCWYRGGAVCWRAVTPGGGGAAS